MLIITFFMYTVSCNSAMSPENICNDPLWKCAYLTDVKVIMYPVNVSIPTTSCISPYPSTVTELQMSVDFIRWFILTAACGVVELTMLVLLYVLIANVTIEQRILDNPVEMMVSESTLEGSVTSNMFEDKPRFQPYDIPFRNRFTWVQSFAKELSRNSVNSNKLKTN
jgi:hypothetical protein